MIEINRENIEEICQKLNDMEYDDATDKEICDWFIQLKRDFCADFNKFYDEGYEHDEISFEYFGCIDDYNEVKEIVEVTIEGNKLKILNSHMFNKTELTNTIKIPLDYTFERETFMKLWKKKVVEGRIKNLRKDIEENHRKILKAQEQIILEKNKIVLAN
jgi:CTP:phosphocholine cytidylyltransferase-like protein